MNKTRAKGTRRTELSDQKKVMTQSEAINKV